MFGTVTCFFSFGCVLADEDGLRQCFSTKGANGVFCCMECRNVCNNGAKSCVVEGDPFIVDISCVDVNRFLRKRNETVWEQVDTLTCLATRSRQVLKETEIKYGPKHNEHGLMQCKPLRAHVRPIDVIRHDPAHMLFAHGIVCNEVMLLLALLATINVTIADIHEFMSKRWHRPYSLRSGTPAKEAWSPSRTKQWPKTGHIGFFASEVVTFLPLLCHFCEDRRIQSRLPLEVDSLKKLSHLCRLVAKGKRGQTTRAEIDAANFAHGTAFIVAYDGEGIVPKFHYTRKLGRQYELDSFLMDTFVTERKHSMLKMAGEATDNTSMYEVTMLSRALALHSGQLRNNKLIDGLHMPQHSPEFEHLLGVHEANVASRITIDGTIVAVGDMIHIRDRIAEVALCIAYCEHSHAEVEFAFLLSWYAFVEHASSAADLWRPEGNQQFVEIDNSSSFALSPMWLRCDDGRLLAFH